MMLNSVHTVGLRNKNRLGGDSGDSRTSESMFMARKEEGDSSDVWSANQESSGPWAETGVARWETGIGRGGQCRGWLLCWLLGPSIRESSHVTAYHGLSRVTFLRFALNNFEPFEDPRNQPKLCTVSPDWIRLLIV